MTQTLFREDAYRTECSATVTAITEQGIVLDRTVFYPMGGGQAGDAGLLILADGREIAISDTRKGKNAEGQFTEAICHLPDPVLVVAGLPAVWAGSTLGEYLYRRAPEAGYRRAALWILGAAGVAAAARALI